MGDQEQRQQVVQLKQELEKERSARKQLHHDKVSSVTAPLTSSIICVYADCCGMGYGG